MLATEECEQGMNEMAVIAVEKSDGESIDISILIIYSLICQA